MMDEILHIDELRLRVPGLPPEDARSLGDEVTQRIADGLPDTIRPTHLGALELRIMVPTGTPRDRLASLIAEAISGRLT